MKRASIHSFRMTAVWRREDADVGKEFEFKTLIRVPGIAEPFNAGEGRFVFKTVLYRLIAGFHHDLPPQSGAIVVTSEIRSIGTAEWLKQQYIIPVDRIDSANQPQLPLSDDA